MTSQAGEPQHPIQVVSRRTGLTPDVIRAWERRYQAIEPIRASNGRRLYSDYDVEKLNLLRRATTIGRRISEVAELDVSELYTLVENDENAVVETTRPQSNRPSTGSVIEHFEECLDAIKAMNPNDLKLGLSRAANTLGTAFLLEDLLKPLITHVRDECRAGRMRLAHDQMATTMASAYMCMLSASPIDSSHSGKVVVATPPGQLYGLSALRTAVAANAYGWETIYLGTSLPVDEIAFATEQAKASAIILGISKPVNDPHLPNALRILRQTLADPIAIIVSGAAVSSYQAVVEEIRAIRVEAMSELRLALDRLST